MNEVEGEIIAERAAEFSRTVAPIVGTESHDGESFTITEDVIFLEPGQEKAQNIVKAISHQNAGEVMQLLSLEGPLRLSDIADRLGMSLNAAKYHIENLMNAGLLEIANTKYSVKGRKVKVYRLKNQVFIVAPRMSGIAEVRSALLKYGAALGIFIVVFSFTLIQPFVRLPSVPAYIPGAILTGQTATSPVATDSSLIPALIVATAVTLFLLACYEINNRRKNRNSTF